jgi:hypothetical protein
VVVVVSGHGFMRDMAPTVAALLDVKPPSATGKPLF